MLTNTRIFVINPPANTVLFLMGPTASGKTDLAIKISQKIKSRLISVDSALIYQGMDIGTAKPSKKTLNTHPHHLIDICKPSEAYSAHDFVTDATQQIELAFRNNELPILVGGTSFYFNAIEHGLSDLPESTPESREKYNQLLKEQGSKALHQTLQKIDPVAANRIHAHDSQRITRALEVFDISGQTLTTLQGKKQGGLNCIINKIILMPDRSELHQRIETRFHLMMEQGFIEEVKALKANTKLHQDLPSIRCVGYRQAWQFLNQEIDEAEMIERSIIATRQLCKRQSTWLKNETQGLTLKTADLEKSLNFIQEQHV
ncbi:tRNA (adenosine(37)-N6)-dimethylallyltransferase MiaA [Candidatus Thioglobus sp.]|jgi:tRNA dimethylallyltransferase|uniref:tRNA (adenosine(37)-N6)-dimethylallyltransferase MiaA n=1 Tax=Candidatus Thioglobus sp. TaxID=2026721 RepID=UPI001DA86AE7|nr:tRNA (adenosine(37)-N6)-dimethylallyltransferase MiaA [Candidatus Thioglobus sp.]MBT3276625.1 tRNA (adenosine(37)-N6)-dimethylallyltransferase MiaA [Candidatus Thioglobus sp.]MBT3447662.1 tRNA (adenosine(37)-N6)-dimethylallyltransferase MiaA [Candidatus Thioglobus sp.]MBT4000644.1 tRNA (adenosine(37)-N6)-dimethylallyltransferase MiaA [Candidatus Thioglobus sp.]MBT4422262.1 tRNA (adenosine(37)-N6)-dimethylallyltransferase MiaA [Candidatus Thioglobus sp.]MBT4746408.1 tRNA (adenosine(37)-N6)-d